MDEQQPAIINPPEGDDDMTPLLMLAAEILADIARQRAHEQQPNQPQKAA